MEIKTCFPEIHYDVKKKNKKQEVLKQVMKSMRLKKGKTVKFRKMATIFDKNKGLKSEKV